MWWGNGKRIKELSLLLPIRARFFIEFNELIRVAARHALFSRGPFLCSLTASANHSGCLRPIIGSFAFELHPSPPRPFPSTPAAFVMLINLFIIIQCESGTQVEWVNLSLSLSLSDFRTLAGKAGQQPNGVTFPAQVINNGNCTTSVKVRSNSSSNQSDVHFDVYCCRTRYEFGVGS